MKEYESEDSGAKFSNMGDYLRVNKSLIPLFIPLLVCAFWLGGISVQMHSVNKSLETLAKTQVAYLLTQKDVDMLKEQLHGLIEDVEKHQVKHEEHYHNLETKTIDGNKREEG